MRGSRVELHKKPFWDHGGTLNELDSVGEAPERDRIKSLNWKVHPDGKSMVKRLGCEKHDTSYSFGGEKIRGLFDFKDTSGNLIKVLITEKKIWIYNTSTQIWTQVYSQATALAGPVKPVAFESGRPLIVGFDDNLYIEGTNAYTIGIIAPTSACTAADSGVAGNPNGTYKYLITFYRSGNYPCESNPSPESTEVTVSSKKINLSSIPVSSDPKVNCRRIYRTKAGGAIFYWLDDINDNVTTTYQDNYSDDDIAESDTVSYDRYPPPKADVIEVWDDRVWYLIRSENKVYRTNKGEAEERASGNFFTLKAREPGDAVTMKEFGDALYIFKGKFPFKISKVGDSYYQLDRLKIKTDCVAPASVAVFDDIMLWKSSKGIEIFNGFRVMRPMLSRYIEKRTLKSINKGSVEKCFGEINENEGEYWLSIPTGSNTETNKVTVLNPQIGSFDVYEFHKNMTAFYNTMDADSNPIFISGSDDGNFYVQNTGYSDDGEPIKSNWKKAWFNMGGEQEIANVLRRLFVKYILEGNHNLILQVYRNFKRNPYLRVELPGIMIEGDEDIRNEIIRRINARVPGTQICFEFVNNEVLESECRVIGFDGYFKRKTWRKDVTGE